MYGKHDRHKPVALVPLTNIDDAVAVICDLVGGGVLERFPDLHFIAVEFSAFWLAGLMAGMDKVFTLGIGQDPDGDFAAGIYDTARNEDDQPMMVRMFSLNDKWP